MFWRFVPLDVPNISNDRILGLTAMMLSQRLILAWVFRLSGLSIGIPSLVIWVQLAIAYATEPRVTASSSPPVDIHNDGLVGLLAYGARGIAFLLGSLIELVREAFVVLAVVAFGMSLLGALLFQIGSGIGKGAAWAQVTALIIAALCLPLWLGLISLPNVAFRIIAVFGGTFSLWAVWVLLRQFR